MNVVIWSKNRACQLELLLRSMRRMAPIFLDHLSVVYTSSNDLFMEGYKKLQGEWKGINWMSGYKRQLFKELTLSAIDGDRSDTVFFVDDMVFRKEWSPKKSPGYQAFCSDPNVLCFSLRINRSLNFCHPKNAPEVPPVFSGCCWTWAGCTPTYAYPMSVDGHIFRTGEILPDLKALPYDNPNTLESILVQKASLKRLPLMSCDDESSAFGVPANLVNTTYKNRHMGGSVEDLNQRWLAGERIALEPFVGYPNKAVHEEVEYTFEKTP